MYESMLTRTPQPMYVQQSGSMPIRSLTAFLEALLAAEVHQMYRDTFAIYAQTGVCAVGGSSILIAKQHR